MTDASDVTDREPFDMEVEDPQAEGAPQGSEAWHTARAGCFTASAFADLSYDSSEFKSGPRKGQPRPSPQSRNKQIDRVVSELLTGKVEAGPKAKTLDWGHAMEPEALALYEQREGRMVETVEFIRHPTYPFAGATPDALVDEDGGCEVKCPYSATVHAGTLREGLPDEHVYQIQGGLWVTGRAWWDFISYNPDFPPGLRLYVQRVERDEAVIAQIEADVLQAWADVQSVLARLGPAP